MPQLRAVWERVDATPCFDWVSVWDHLGSLVGTAHNLEAVAMHAALATSTVRVRCACLVYSAGYRPPLVLASAIATIDHLSAGRAVLGLGAGYLASEYEAQGLRLPSPAERSVLLAETVVVMRSLLDGDEVWFDGEQVQLTAARCAPRPLQDRLPIVVGGGGERRTIPLAGRFADGWNVPMASPTEAARKIALLRVAEAAADRLRGSVEATLNVGLCFDTDAGPDRYGARWDVLRGAVLTGSTQQVVETVAAYVDAGADRLMLSLRAPYDGQVHDELDRFAAEIAPVFF